MRVHGRDDFAMYWCLPEDRGASLSRAAEGILRFFLFPEGNSYAFLPMDQCRNCWNCFPAVAPGLPSSVSVELERLLFPIHVLAALFVASPFSVLCYALSHLFSPSTRSLFLASAILLQAALLPAQSSAPSPIGEKGSFFRPGHDDLVYKQYLPSPVSALS